MSFDTKGVTDAFISFKCFVHSLLGRHLLHLCHNLQVLRRSEHLHVALLKLTVRSFQVEVVGQIVRLYGGLDQVTWFEELLNSKDMINLVAGLNGAEKFARLSIGHLAHLSSQLCPVSLHLRHVGPLASGQSGHWRYWRRWWSLTVDQRTNGGQKEKRKNV